ncbi:MAG TPA: DUF3710 domain-containing protein [Actinomycetota bacterium]|nr:DUF3710 domain-containing protein [Actinomycetota bacterium]
MFKRRRGGSADDEQNSPDEQLGEATAMAEDEPATGSANAGQGPFDASALPDDEIDRVDLGGLQIPIVDNMQLTLDGHNEETNTFAIATVILEEQQAALQLMAVAAPRSGGFWAEVMDEIEADITQAGGSMSRSEGRFGPELAGDVPTQDPQGNTVMQTARFVGAEGNRWFIRGMFLGQAATSPAMGEFFEDILAGCVVNRGERPMAPGDLIALTPPQDLEAEGEDDEEEPGGYDDLEPFERGPEITETH